MSLQEDFVAYLKTQASLTDVVQDRIAQDTADQKWTRPCIVFTRIGRSSDLALDGSGGFYESEYSVFCLGDSPREASDLADRLAAALDGYRGQWGSTTINGVFVIDQSDDSQRFPVGSENTRNQVEVTVRIFSTEA